MSLIRNIVQTTQEREIIKIASDLIVYIGGQNYLINPNLGVNGTPVPFNDYIAAWTASYDIDAMIPSGSITLAVPRDQDYLFRSPGGNNILQTMEDIRVFEKGYYLSDSGNSIYYQVFKGFITSVSYSETNTMTNITISCKGSMGLLEKMQVDLAPGVMSSSAQGVTPFGTTNWNMNPYQMIAWALTYKGFVDGFTLTSINQSAMNPNNRYWDAVSNDYIAKWFFLLVDLARDTHIFGALDPNDIVNEMSSNLTTNPEKANPRNRNTQAIAHDTKGTVTESQAKDISSSIYNKIREYHPEFSIGDIQLINGKTTTRLERLRTAVALIGFEAYQDLDGAIIVKPPVYNLDVTNMADAPTQTDSTVDKIRADRNPFVVYLSEILNEAESEDEAGIRITRMTVLGSLTGGGNQLLGNSYDGLVPVVEEIDIGKLAQFGVRTEPPFKAAWLQDSDKKAMYGFAASEMAKANLGFRSYTITIPSRPELKLGFPMYLPHRDIYGYIKSISSSYTKGGTSTMTVTLTGLRRRPLLPAVQDFNGIGGVQQKTLLTPQPDLVLIWTTPPEPLTSANGTTTTAFAPTLNGEGQLEADATASLPVTNPTSQDMQVNDYKKNHVGSTFGTQYDTPGKAWRVQFDKDKKFSSGSPRVVDADYFNDLLTVRPYTDDKGYELIGPFPWGRWASLKAALYDFTVYAPSNQVTADGSSFLGGFSNTKGSITPTSLPSAATPIDPSTQTLSGPNDPFLFTGTATPATTPNAVGALTTALQAQTKVVTNAKVFELSYDSNNVPSTLPGIDSVDQANLQDISAVDANEDSTDARVAAFLTGTAQVQKLSTRIVNSTTNPGGN